MWCITKWQIPIERRKCPFVRTNQHKVPQQLQAHTVPWEGICLLWQLKKNTLFIGKSCAQLSGGLGLSPWLQRTCTVLGLDWECERARGTARAVPSATRPGWHHETKAAPSPCCLWVGECLCLWISPGLCMKDNSRCMSHQSRGSWSSSYVSLCLRQQIMEWLLV